MGTTRRRLRRTTGAIDRTMVGQQHRDEDDPEDERLMSTTKRIATRMPTT